MGGWGGEDRTASSDANHDDDVNGSDASDD